MIITSNRTRDVHDALKRRCLYHWVEHPDFEREVAIVAPARPRGRPTTWRARSSAAVQVLRALGLYKPPGVAETIDWARRLAALGQTEVNQATVLVRSAARHHPEVPRRPGAPTRAHGLDVLVRGAADRAGERSG